MDSLRLKMCSLEPTLYNPEPMPLLVLDLSVYQTRPFLLSGLNLFYNSHLSGNLTINGL